MDEKNEELVDAQIVEEDSRMSVSYTHLTLPTNSRV